MHNTRLSIFILPVLIIGLSVFTTYVEENPSFRSLFQISQVANPSVNDEGQSLIDEVQSEPEDIQPDERSETDSTPKEEEKIDDTKETEPIKDEKVTEQPDPSNSGSSQSEEPSEVATTESPEQEPSENSTPEQSENPIEPDSQEEIDKQIQDAELLAKKLSEFEVTRSNISIRFQANLARLEIARDSLSEKIALMEQNGKDTTQAKDALMNLNQAIKTSQKYIKDSTKPESVPGIQRVLTEYVKNARESIQEGYTALFQAINDAQ